MPPDSKLRILLIDAAERWPLQDGESPRICVVPVGLLYLASSLRAHLRDMVETRILDTSLEGFCPGAIKELLAGFSPRIVGIRCIAPYVESARRIAALVREELPESLIVLGGPATGAYLDDLFRGGRTADVAVIGEGEEAIVEIARRVMKNESLEGIPGTARMTESGIGYAPPGNFIAHLDSLPFPDPSFIDLDRYAGRMSYSYNKRRQGIILTSRGCPYNCIFCHRFMGQKFRARSPESVLEEITRLYEGHGVRDFYVIDDNFTLDRGRAEKILDMITASGMKLNLNFNSGLRADITDRPLIDKMIKAGTRWISFAVETASPRLQRLINKNLDLEKARDTINYAFERGANVVYFMMFGLPTETAEEALMTVEYARTLRPPIIPTFFCAKYFRGTEMHEMAKRSGFDMARIERASRVPYHDIRYTHTPSMSSSELRKVYMEFVEEVFLDRERLSLAIGRQMESYTTDEILDTYHILLGRPFPSIEGILEQAGMKKIKS
jgi:radical SAM superfamily enzyme YgiQ (UPF0313 family)